MEDNWWIKRFSIPVSPGDEWKANSEPLTVLKLKIFLKIVKYHWMNIGRIQRFQWEKEGGGTQKEGGAGQGRAEERKSGRVTDRDREREYKMGMFRDG